MPPEALMIGEHPVHPLAESLLEVIRHNPTPDPHTSSLWKEYSDRMVVERTGDRLLLGGAGFTSHSKSGWIGQAVYGLERLSYASYTRTLHPFPEVWEEAIRLARSLGVSLTRHEWSSAVVLAILEDHFRTWGLQPKTFALIGDGDGFLGNLLLRRFHCQGIRIFTVDLPKTLMFQLCTYQKAASRQPVPMALLTGAQQPDPSTRVTFVLPQAIERICEGIDCAVNLVSMQEMKPSSIAAYFAFLRKRSLPPSRFYCCNRLYKELPGGEVASFRDYPWSERDEIFLDAPCPYFSHYLEGRTHPEGPRFLGVRVPWVNHFAGRSWHRLVHLGPEGG